MKFWNTTPLWAGAAYNISLSGWWRLLWEQPLSFHSSSLIISGTLIEPYFSNPLIDFKTHLNSIQIFHILSQLPRQQCNYIDPCKPASVWPALTMFSFFPFSGFLKREEAKIEILYYFTFNLLANMKILNNSAKLTQSPCNWVLLQNVCHSTNRFE